MAELQKIATVNELKNGDMKQVDLPGKEILLARVNDRYYAVNNRCPHLGGKLVNGDLNGTVVTCPLHGSQFDLSNGRVIRWTDLTGFAAVLGKLFKAPKSLNVYPIKIENDDILIEL